MKDDYPKILDNASLGVVVLTQGSVRNATSAIVLQSQSPLYKVTDTLICYEGFNGEEWIEKDYWLLSSNNLKWCWSHK